MPKSPAQLDREIALALGTAPLRVVGRAPVARPAGGGKRVAKTRLIYVVQGNYGYRARLGRRHGRGDVEGSQAEPARVPRQRERSVPRDPSS
jgi:hypothetical protein